VIVAGVKPGILFVISAPSGTGKSTIARELVRRASGLLFSISFTTRPPREAEEYGKDYFFIERGRFEEMIAEGEFLEWARVFDNLYGTGLEVSRRILDDGRDLLLDIDTQGARQVREGPLAAVSVMILPPDFATLTSRLAGRGSEDASAMDRRLAEAREEAEEYREFDYLVVNDDLERTVDAITAIVYAERLRTGRRCAEADRILDTFPKR
jgi:guanylate kinase